MTPRDLESHAKKAAQSRAPAMPQGDAALAHMPWLPILETGHQEIDQEHQVLLEAINVILAIFARRGAWPELIAAVVTLRDRCAEHFRNEDRLFRAMRFPGADRHRRSHRRILAEINGVIAALETVDAPAQADWDRALSVRGLLVDHLLREDLAYKSHLMHVGTSRP
ncbi:MAG TPA: hemerythrin domain-containing protein [Dongiaceae bacterium]|nr:hemerythrin domain-containing protein [Dongiaceae bacterium]